MRVHHSPLLRSLQKISGILLAGGILFGTFLLFPVQSRGATPERTTPGVRPVPDSVLAGMRGGFSWGGINFSFGIESSTFVNGALMVKTILQTVGNELLVETGSNPFQSSTGNGSPQVSATVSASTASVSKTVSNNVLNSNSGGSQQATNTISSPSLTVSSSSSTPPRSRSGPFRLAAVPRPATLTVTWSRSNRPVRGTLSRTLFPLRRLTTHRELFPFSRMPRAIL